MNGANRSPCFVCLVLAAMVAAPFAACAARNDDERSVSASAPAEPARDAEARSDRPSSDASIPQPSVDAAIETEDAGPPRIDFIGRFDARDAAGPKCGWPGCRIVARFQGTEAKVRLAEIDEPWMEGAPSRWDVAVDGTWGPTLVLSPGASEYVVATSLPVGPHTVELYKRSEAQNGTTQFLGLDLAGGTLLAPPPRKQRRLEIIADSAAAGFGVEGIGFPDRDCPGVDYGAEWQNFRVSLGARLGELVGADVFGTVFSGKGIAKNVWHPDKDTLPVLFSLANPIDKTSTWDFSWIPDVVVVMAGGNDFEIGQPVDTGPATPEEFQTAYRAFVASIREKYALAHVFLAVSPTLSDAKPPGRNSRTNVLGGVNAVVDAHNAAGDDRVYAVVPSEAQPSEVIGCNGHGSRAFHDRVAQELKAFITPRVGW